MERIIVKSTGTLPDNRLRGILPAFLLILTLIPISAGAEALLTEDDLLSAAMDGNTEILKIRNSMARASADLKGARAEKLPSLTFDTSFNYFTDPLEPVILQAGESGVIDIGGEEIMIPPEDVILYEGMEDTYYQFGLTLEQPLFTWGKLDNAVEIYTLLKEISGYKLMNLERQVRMEIRGTLEALSVLERIESILAEQDRAAVRLVDISRESYENGFLLYTDYLNAQIEARQVTMALAELNQSRASLTVNLQKLTGMEHLTVDGLRLPPPESAGTGVLPDPETFLREVRQNNQNLAMLTTAREIAGLQTDIARNQDSWKPDLGLRLTVDYGGSRFPFVEKDWYRQNRFNATFSLGMSASLFDSGRRSARVLSETLAEEDAALQYAETWDMLRELVHTSYLKMELSRQKMEYYTLLMENDQVQSEQKETLWKSGSGGENDYLTARIQYYTDRVNYYSEVLDYLNTYYLLETLR